MTAPQHRLIQQAVVQWHNKHPLAQRIDTSQVHSLGWVALPFMRPAQGIEPSLDAPSATPRAAPAASADWRSRLGALLGRRKAAGGQGGRVFSDRFIDGLSPQRAAAFALQHGVAGPQAAADAPADWPQRRIEVDSRMAERAAGAWPTELWVVSAAVEHADKRVRVLISADGSAVVGPRLWNPWKWQGLVLASLLVVGSLAAWQWHSRAKQAELDAALHASGPVKAPGAAASGVVKAASAAVASASAPASDPASAASAAMSDPASAAEAASAASAPAAAVTQPMPSASEPLIDIRPRLRPPTASRPPLGAASEPTSPPAAAKAATPPEPPPRPATAKDATKDVEGRPAPKPAREAKPARGAATPENIVPGQQAGGPVVALVGPALLTKADADLMLERMLTHLGQTMGKTTGLQGEVLETAEGWRAAVYPFATREEAQILNATMVARGWRTRAVTF
jgi:hypothetical protein